MGKVTGFKEFQRELPKYRPVEERIHDYREIPEEFPEDKLRQQAARCMDCGVPFCHSGCPLGNIIPDWNDLTYKGKWREAWQRLSRTNNFPEFTGRLCPAPCEEACVLNIPETPIAIELIEKTIIEKAFENGWVVPEPPAKRTGKKVAVVGSGPSGLAAAQQLNRAGHTVTVFERADKIGGLLRYGIPDFKLEKSVIDRRTKLMAAEGIIFKTGAYLGQNVPASELKAFDAVVLCGGATKPRDLNVPGRELAGIHFAMEYLQQQNKAVAASQPRTTQINAKGKHVIVIGGGDTGSDCIGTARRQGAKSITNFELFPMPGKSRPAHQPWPFWPMRLRSSTSHYEGVERFWCINTQRFTGTEGRVQRLVTATVEFVKGADGRPQLQALPFSEHEWQADLVLLALGFVGPEPNVLLAQLGVELDKAGNVKTDGYRTNLPNVFAAGDMRRGQSLIVWAISEGREAARAVDAFLMGTSALPMKGNGDMLRV